MIQFFFENGKIPDSHFSASRSHAEVASPVFARLNGKNGAGAWCHPTVWPEDLNEYLQVN